MFQSLSFVRAALLLLTLALSSAPAPQVSAPVFGASWWALMSMLTSRAEVVDSGEGVFLAGVVDVSATGKDARAGELTGVITEISGLRETLASPRVGRRWYWKCVPEPEEP
jgi:hypothetical protein